MLMDKGKENTTWEEVIKSANKEISALVMLNLAIEDLDGMFADIQAAAESGNVEATMINVGSARTTFLRLKNIVDNISK